MVFLFFRVPKEYKLQKKIEQGEKIETNFISQFSPEILRDKEKFLKAFTIDAKPYENIHEYLKRQVIEDNVETIQGLSDEDKEFVVEMLYANILECKNNGKQIRDFLRKKLNLKYKYMASAIVRQQFNKAHVKLHRLESLELGVTKAEWICLGDCSIPKHKFMHGLIFSLDVGFFDDELNKYIFPADLEGCTCTFVGKFDFDEGDTNANT